MDAFSRRSIDEYRRQINLKDSFALQTERLKTILESSDWKSPTAPTAENGGWRCRALLLIAPLVEIAWADGRVTRRESDAILQAAETYGLIDDQSGYCELLDNLTSRPSPQARGRMWQEFRGFIESLSESEREDLKFCLSVQTQFVAEQSSNNLINFLRGERVCKTETEHLQIISEQLESACAAAKSLDEKRRVVREAENAEREISYITAAADYYYGKADLNETFDDYSKLIPLVPLVKTAWAEGRVTRRERHLVFEAAKRLGIKPGTAVHARLAEWLELHPTDEFYDSALEILRHRWQKLSPEEKARRKFELLNDCTRIAEASGGAKHSPSGGAKICNEEIVAVKRIARKLNAAATV